MHQVYISWRSLAPQFSCSLSARRRTSYFVSRGHEFVKTVHPGPFSSPEPRNMFYKQTSAFVQEGITLAYSVQVILFRFPLHYSPTSYKWSSAASVRGRGQLDTFGFTPHKVNRCCRWFFFRDQSFEWHNEVFSWSPHKSAIRCDVRHHMHWGKKTLNFLLELKLKVRNS